MSENNIVDFLHSTKQAENHHYSSFYGNALPGPYYPTIVRSVPREKHSPGVSSFFLDFKRTSFSESVTSAGKILIVLRIQVESNPLRG